MRRPKDEEFAEEEEEFRRALDAVPPPTPPDGGWGWIVVFSSFFMNLIVDGVCYSYGIIMPELLEAFNTSTAMMSLGGALLLGTYMMSGPVASALCNRFGSRRIALLGCTISTTALLFSPAAAKGSIFVVVFGLAGGVGFGLMFLASLVVVGFYFEMNRGVAATLAMCGSSVGMALLAPFTRWLLTQFNWIGTLILLAGVVLHGMVLASLLRPIDADLQRRKKLILKRMEEDKRLGVHTCVILQRLIEQKKHDRTMSSGSLNNGIITKDNQVIKEKDFHKHFNIFSGIKAAFSKSSINTEGQSRVGASATPSTQYTPAIVVNDPSPCSSTENSPMIRRSRSSSPNNLRKQVLISQSAGQLKKNMSARSLVTFSQTTPADAGKEFSSVQELPQTDGDDEDKTFTSNTEYLLRKFLHATPNADRPMYRKDIYYTGSVQILPQYHNDIDEYVASITEIPHRSQTDFEDCWSRLNWLPKSIIDVLRAVFDSQTFTSPTYVLLLIATSLTMLGYYVPFLLLPMYTVSIIDYRTGGHPISAMTAATLLTILGVSNTFGRVIAGVLGTRKWVDSLVINNLALLIAGVITMLLPFCKHYFLLSLFAVVFGICVAAFSSLRSLIVVELMGLDKLTTCYSQLVIFHGLAVVVGTPLAGFLYDQTGSFDISFYFSGGAMLLSGFLSMPLRKISQWERKKRNDSFTSQDSCEDDMKKNVYIKPQELVGL